MLRDASVVGRESAQVFFFFGCFFFLQPGSAVILNPALAVADKPPRHSHAVANSKYFRFFFFGKSTKEQTTGKKKDKNTTASLCHCISLPLCVCVCGMCVVCVVHLKENWGSALVFVGSDSSTCSKMQIRVRWGAKLFLLFVLTCTDLQGPVSYSEVI